MRNYNILNLKDFKKIFILILVFAFLKAISYFSPILLKPLTTVIEYGRFEYSFNLGQVLTALFSMGLAPSFAYFMLTKKQTEKRPIFHLHFFLLSICLFIFLIISPKSLNNVYFGSALIGIAFANQQLISSILKIKEKNLIAVTIDTGIYIILFTLVTLDYFNVVDFTLDFWHTAILMYIFIITSILHLPRLKGFDKLLKSDYSEIYKYSFLIVLSSPLLLLINASTRLYLENILGLEAVSNYSYYFRISSFVLIFSRVIIILLYAQLFTAKHSKLDLYFSRIMVFIFFSNIVLFYLLGFALNIETDILIINNKRLLCCCFFQVNFWITTSFLEPIIQRENLMKEFILGLIMLFVILILGLALSKEFEFISIELIVIINTLIIFLLFLLQYYILMKKNIFYKKSLTVHLMQGIIFIVLIFIVLL